MTCIAWDGDTLAIDKAVTSNYMQLPDRKWMSVRQHQADGIVSPAIVMWAGDVESGLMLAKWYEDGACREDWPDFQSDINDKAILVGLDSVGAFYYDCKPIKQRVRHKFYAFGSGRDFAMGAMAHGANAVEAVEIANRFEIYCGQGVDSFTADDL